MRQAERKCIGKVRAYVPGKPIEEVRRELGLKRVIKLASNENPLGPSPKAVAAMRKALGSLNRYPDANGYYLKKALAAALGVGSGEVVLGNGSDEIITLAARAFIEEGDEVVIAKPTFLIYEIACRIADARIRAVPLRGLRHDLAAMARAVTRRTKMVFIANPDNPTGTYVTARELEGFLGAIGRDVIVFLDEAYFEFAKGLSDYPDGVAWLKAHRGRRVIVARTFSKAYGLSGIRAGYGIAGGGLGQYLERVREPFNVNLLAQAGACAALKDRAFLARTIRHTLREKARLYDELAALGFRTVKSATNFFLIDAGKRAKALAGRLLREGIIVRHLEPWGLTDLIRVTIGTRGENARLVQTLKEIKGERA